MRYQTRSRVTVELIRFGLEVVKKEQQKSINAKGQRLSNSFAFILDKKVTIKVRHTEHFWRMAYIFKK